MLSVYQILAITSLCAVLFLCLVMLLKVRRGLGYLFLTIALVVWVGIEVQDLLLMIHPEQLMFWKKGVILCESMLPVLWLLVAFTHFRTHRVAQFNRIHWLLLSLASCFIPVAFVLPVERVFFSPDFGSEWILFLGQAGYFYYLGILLFLLMGLAQFGQTFFTLSKDQRTLVRYEFLGVGLMLVTLIIFYSQPLMYRSIDMSLVKIRPVMMLLAMSMIFISRIRRQSLVSLKVSFNVAYHSAAVFVAGIYLVIIGLLGQGLRYYSFSGQRVLFIVLSVLLGLFFVAIILSDRLRRGFRVFLHKHFVQGKYDYRDNWIKLTEKLAAARTIEDLQLVILLAFCDFLDAGYAALFQFEPELRGYTCQQVLNNKLMEQNVALDDPAIQDMKLDGRVLDMRHQQSKLLFPDLPASEQMLVVPLRFEDRLEGFVVIGKLAEPDEALTYEDFDMMRAVAAQSTASLLSLRLSEQLATERELAAIGKVSTFVLHDLKNLLSSMQMVVTNAEHHLDNPEFQKDMMATIRGNSAKMKDIIERLGSLKSRIRLSYQRVNLVSLVQAIISETGIGFLQKAPESLLLTIDPDEIAKVIQNLLINAHEAGADKISVFILQVPEPVVVVCDNGKGMSESFVNHRLFKPFETTKNKGFGIGLYQCRNIIIAHGGRMDVTSVEDVGTEFRIYIPEKHARPEVSDLQKF